MIINFIFTAICLAVLGAGGYFFKIQSDQIVELTRVTKAQKNEIEHFRKQMKALSDQELLQKSKLAALAADAAKISNEETSAALALETEKLKNLQQRRKAFLSESPGSKETQDEARKNDFAQLKNLQEQLQQFTALSQKDGSIIKSVDTESQAAHKSEQAARGQRHQTRLNQIKNDRTQMNHLNQQIAAAGRRMKSNPVSASEVEILRTNLQQFQLDITHLEATDQADQDNFNRAKNGFEANTKETKSEIQTEQTKLKDRIKTTHTEIAMIQKRLSTGQVKQSQTTIELANLDAQIKEEEAVIRAMTALSQSAARTAGQAASTPAP